MDPAPMLKSALQNVVADMGRAAKKGRAGKLRRPAKVEMTQLEASPGGLADMMAQPGNGASDLAEGSALSPEMMEELLRDAK